MATPYATPKYPGAPHPTPISQRFQRNTPRAPIHNPYDRFTQPEFDAWIGGLTGALKRALGREDYETQQARTSEPVDRDEEVVEDSFAEVKARRAAKGKEKATGLGNEDQPIEIPSDSEEDVSEDEESDQDVEGEVEAHVYQDGEHIGEDDYEDADEEEEEEGEGENEHEDGDEAEDAHADDDEELNQDAESDEGTEERTEARREHPFTNGEVVELLSDEDEEEVRNIPNSAQSDRKYEVPNYDGQDSEAGSDEAYNPTLNESEFDLSWQNSQIKDGNAEVDVDLAREEDINLAEDEADAEFVGTAAFPPTDQATQPIDLPDLWAGPTAYAEDLYTGGEVLLDPAQQVNLHILPAEQDELDRATMYPLTEEPSQPLELSDSWSGTRLYAEDFYAGGDRTQSDIRSRLPSPSHLTPRDDEVGMFLTPEGLTPDTMSTPNIILAPLTDEDGMEGEKQDEDVSIPGSSAAIFEQLNKEMSLHQPVTAAQGIEEFLEGGAIEDLYADLDNYQSNASGSQQISYEFDEEEDSTQAQASMGLIFDEEGRLSQSSEFVHEGSTSPPRPSLHPHVDWSNRHATSGSEHFEEHSNHDDETDEILEVSDDEVDTHYVEQHGPQHVASVVNLDNSGVALHHNTDRQQENLPSADLPVGEHHGAHARLADHMPEGIHEGGLSEDFSPSQGIKAFPNKAELDGQSVSEVVIDPASAMGVIPKDEEQADATSSRAEQRLDTEQAVRVASEEDDALLRNPIVAVDSHLIPTNEKANGDVADDSSISHISIIAEPPLSLQHDSVADSLSSDGQDLGFIAVSGDDNDLIDYEVEEPLTEGRLTEKPATRHPSQEVTTEEIAFEDHADRTHDSDIRAESSVMNYVVVYPDEEDEVAVQSNLTDAHDGESGNTTTQYSANTLETGVPMPVSADPDVPDPTSVSHTPVFPSSPRAGRSALSSLQDTTTFSGQPESPMADVPSPSRSQSGLFTPLTTDNSLPASPRPANAGLGEETIVPSRLRHVVNVGNDLSAQDMPADDKPSTPQLSTSKDGADPDLLQEGAPVSDADKVEPSSLPTPEDTGAAEPDAIAHVVGIESTTDIAHTGDLELSYPSDRSEDSSSGANLDQNDALVHGDIDAEGDVDSDYALDHTEPSPHGEPSAQDAGKGTDVEAISNDSKTAPGAAEHDASRVESSEEVSQVGHGDQNGLEAPLNTATGDSAGEDLPAENSSKVTATMDEAPAESSSVSSEGDAVSREESRPLKRKRAVNALPPRLTRSMSARDAFKSSEQSAQSAPSRSDKGKQKEADDELSDNDDSASVAQSYVSGSGSTASSFSDASRMLVSRSRASSRASSIISAVTSNASTVSPASPTIMRTASHHRDQPPPPFIHAHGVLHHHHGRPIPQAPVITEHRRATSPSISAPSSTEDVSVAGPSQSHPPPKPLPSSPVTRSNCRFHKISLPREENGPRVYFVIPGCSLGNPELMEEEHIEDHGPATIDRSTRLVADIEGVEFSSYLLGILRQLVGVDLLREQEVFYMPQPGEKYRWKSRRKSKIGKAVLSGKPRKSLGSRNISNAQSVGPSEDSQSLDRPPSRTESASTAGSRRRPRRSSDRGSLTTTTSLSGSEVDEPPPKRLKEDHDQPTESVQVEAENLESVARAVNSAQRRLPIRRSKRLGVDATAYKPNDDDPHESTNDEASNGKRRKRARKAVKRSRPDDGNSEQADNANATAKKRKIREKVPKDKPSPGTEKVT